MQVAGLSEGRIEEILSETVRQERRLVLAAAAEGGDLPIFATLKAETLGGRCETLKTIEEGCYGICLDCGEEIPPARLAAKLTARRCLACQEDYEARYGRV